jgi:adenylate cyclase
MSSEAHDDVRASAPPEVEFQPSVPPPEDSPALVDAAARPTTAQRISRAPRSEATLFEAARALAPTTAAALSSLVRGDARATFETSLGREIRGAERFRALFLLAITTVLLFTLVIVHGAYPNWFVWLLHGQVDIAPVGFFLMAVVGFEVFVLAGIRKRQKLDVPPSASTRYAQALVETSLPTIVVLYYAAVDGPALALLMPPAFVYFVFILLSTLRLDFALTVFTGFVAAAEYALIAVFFASGDGRVDPALASLPHHLAKAGILLVSGIAGGFVAQRLRRSFTRAIESVDERQRILGVFGQHVSPQVVERLVRGHTEVKSELRDVCVMFLDIRDFTAFAEGRSPAEVVDYLNTVFESTIGAITDNHGIINKFLGDGFMAIFGAPIAEGNSCAAAVAAALEIVARVEGLSAGGKIPPTRVGIGLHAGSAVVGNIGSAERKEYTVIGDVVNVASRIEALNKQLGATILASDEVWSAAGRSDVEAIARDSISIRGRAQPVRIWQLA